MSTSGWSEVPRVLLPRAVTLEETAWPLALTSAHGLRPSDPCVRARRPTGHRQDPSCSGTRVLVVALELISLA